MKEKVELIPGIVSLIALVILVFTIASLVKNIM